MKKCNLRAGIATPVIAAIFLCFISLSLGAQDADPVFTVSGSTTIQPIVEKAAELYRKETGKTILVKGGGSGAGIKAVIQKESLLGMASRALTKTEKEAVIPITFGFDTLVFIVNEASPVREITKGQVLNIFSGKISSWNDLTGRDQKIVVVSKEIGRATLDSFEEYTGLRHPDRTEPGKEGYIRKDVFEIASNLEGVTLVGGIPQAIGYVSLGTAISLRDAGMPIAILALDGIAPTPENVANGSYPIVRELNLVALTRDTIAEDFIALLYRKDMQDFMIENGFIPVQNAEGTR